ncbi:hypothetical protein Q4551_03925 [Oceanobacter sp. 5_MG-2023]|uniref:hypothetical protein n=1 Tax=Oceanobacter sp. 5_MG-2023 TaxID=3062645 RepID=UPI0026E2DB13|nr:hypothetical protein [Oceanobacter sp. 5_MG-2023]MDO6681427.1 hypothetical protein [Oceanobacter sp. 5_MG-2023]
MEPSLSLTGQQIPAIQAGADEAGADEAGADEAGADEAGADEAGVGATATLPSAAIAGTDPLTESDSSANTDQRHDQTGASQSADHNAIKAVSSAAADPKQQETTSKPSPVQSREPSLEQPKNKNTAVKIQENVAEWQPPTEQQQALEEDMLQSENPPLNLRLPDSLEQEPYNFSTNPALLPNVFNTQQPASVLDMSGKLYWDESEEAETKPMRENITGAEVELRFRLP